MSTSTPSTQLLTAREVADKLNVSIDTIYLWSSNGTLDQAKVKLGRRVRFKAEVVEQIAREGFSTSVTATQRQTLDTVGMLELCLEHKINPNITHDIRVLGLERRGCVIAITPPQRVVFEFALMPPTEVDKLPEAERRYRVAAAEMAGVAPLMPHNYTGPVILLDRTELEVIDAEVLGIFGGTTIVLISDLEVA
jgi:excisionase family DNA binding protein